MRTRCLILLSLMLTWLVPATASAAEFSLGGYYRLRLLLFQDLTPWATTAEIGDTQTQGLWMHRVRLQPELKFNERVSFHMSLNLLDNTVAGDYPELVDAGSATIPEFFSGSVLANPDYRKNIFIERAWGQVTTGIGQIRFGRMGSHWGLGILANDGNAPGDDFGDTVDRLMFITRIGPIYIVPAVDKVSETMFLQGGQVPPDFFGDPPSVTGQSDDVDQFILALRYSGEIHSGGVYAVYRQQPAANARAYIGDIWGKTRIGPVNVEAEFVYLSAELDSFLVTVPGKMTAAQWGFALESDIEWRQFLFGLDAGAASGDDRDGAVDLDINNFTFDRNYRPALLMFHYIPQYPDGPLGISNAWYVRPWARYSLWENLDFDLVLIHAQALSTSPQFDSRGDYGTEVDVVWRWTLHEDFEWSLQYGALIPGEIYDLVDPAAPESIIHGVEGRFLIRF